MPKEITVEELDSVLPRTQSVSVKRSGESVKFKLRTKKTLFTVKVPLAEADSVESKITSSGASLDEQE